MEDRMRLVVPYRKGLLFRRTFEAAEAWGNTEFVEVRNRNEPANGRPTYDELLSDLWSRGEGFIMLEHDVVPYAGALEAINECAEPWCGYGYSPNGGVSPWFCNLGCTKVSPPLIRVVAEGFRGKPWHVCDAYLSESAGHELAALRQRLHRGLLGGDWRGIG
jgi:hypothetical protein